MSRDITRHSLPTQTITVTDTIGTCTAIDMEHAAGAGFSVAGSTTLLTFYVCETKNGTYVALYDKDNAAVTRTVAASKAYALPDECFPFPYVKALGDAAGTLTLSAKG